MGQGHCLTTSPIPQLEIARGATAISLGKFPSAILWAGTGARQASWTVWALATEQIRCHSCAQRLFPGFSLHVSETCKRSITVGAQERAMAFYFLM